MIVFLHGFGSSGTISSTGQSVKEIFPDVDVQCFSYDYLNPDKSASDIIDQLQQVNTKDIELVIGVSLGGFWARWLANKIGAPLVLINPSLSPQTSLQNRMDFDSSYLQEFDKYSVERDNLDLPITVLLGTDDEVVHPSGAIKLYLERAKIVLVEGGKHRLTKKQMANTLTVAYNTVLQ